MLSSILPDDTAKGACAEANHGRRLCNIAPCHERLISLPPQYQLAIMNEQAF